MTRTVTTHEPRWTEQDRAEALALALYRASLCPHGCGQLVSDSTTDEDDGPEFVAHRTTCRACAELIDARAVVADGKAPSPHTNARLWHIEMRKR